MLPPPCFTVQIVPAFLEPWCLAFRPNSSILVSSEQRILLLMVRVFGCLLANYKWAVMCLLLRSGFRLATNIKAWWGECGRDSCPSGRFSHLHRGTLELCQSDHRILGHLPDQGTSPPIAQFGQAASSRKSLGGSKLLPLKNDGGHCVLGNFQCCRTFLVPFPRSVPRRNPVSELYGQFLWPHGLIFCSDMHCQLCDLI